MEIGGRYRGLYQPCWSSQEANLTSTEAKRPASGTGQIVPLNQPATAARILGDDFP